MQFLIKDSCTLEQETQIIIPEAFPHLLLVASFEGVLVSHPHPLAVSLCQCDLQRFSWAHRAWAWGRAEVEELWPQDQLSMNSGLTAMVASPSLLLSCAGHCFPELPCGTMINGTPFLMTSRPSILLSSIFIHTSWYHLCNKLFAPEFSQRQLIKFKISVYHFFFHLRTSILAI